MDGLSRGGQLALARRLGCCRTCAAGFGFGCGGNDDFEDGAVGMNCAICGWQFSEGLSRRVSWRVAQEEMSTHVAASVVLREVGSVGMDVARVPCQSGSI